MHIRKFQTEDHEIIKKLSVDVFEDVSIDKQIENQFGLINEKNWQWRFGKQVDDDVQTDSNGIFVMIDDEEVVGWISSVIDHESKIGHIPHMGVKKGHHGKGIGRQLIMFVMKRFQNSGMTHAQIESLVHNQPANHLYQSIGFQNMAEKIYYAMDLNTLNSEMTQ